MIYEQEILPEIAPDLASGLGPTTTDGEAPR